MSVSYQIPLASQNLAYLRLTVWGFLSFLISDPLGLISGPFLKIRPQGSEIRPPILRNSDMTSMLKIQTDITDYASEILFLKYCVVSELFKIMSYLANSGGLISDPLGLILDP